MKSLQLHKEGTKCQHTYRYYSTSFLLILVIDYLLVRKYAYNYLQLYVTSFSYNFYQKRTSKLLMVTVYSIKRKPFFIIVKVLIDIQKIFYVPNINTDNIVTKVYFQISYKVVTTLICLPLNSDSSIAIAVCTESLSPNSIYAKPLG